MNNIVNPTKSQCLENNVLSLELFKKYKDYCLNNNNTKKSMIKKDNTKK